MNDRLLDSFPWSPEDVLRYCAAQFAAMCLLVAAWWSSSRSAVLHDQLTSLDLAAVGVILSGGANAAWLIRARIGIAQRRRQLLPNPVRPSATTPDATTGIRATQPSPTALVTTAAMTRYHRPSCPLVRGKAVVPLDDRTRRPCGVCLP